MIRHKLLALALLVGSVLPRGGAWAAELHFDYVTSHTGAGPLMTQQFRVSKQAVEVTMAPSTIYLYTRADQRLYVINHTTKTYIPVDGQMLAQLGTHLAKQRDRVREILAKEPADGNPVVRNALETSIAQIDNAIQSANSLAQRKKVDMKASKTGARKTYGGFECETYRISISGGTGDGCYASLDQFGVAEEFMQAAIDALGAIEAMSGVSSPFTAVAGAFPATPCWVPGRWASRRASKTSRSSRPARRTVWSVCRRATSARGWRRPDATHAPSMAAPGCFVSRRGGGFQLATNAPVNSVHCGGVFVARGTETTNSDRRRASDAGDWAAAYGPGCPRFSLSR